MTSILERALILDDQRAWYERQPLHVRDGLYRAAEQGALAYERRPEVVLRDLIAVAMAYER